MTLTGIISAFLTALGIAIILAGTIAGLAIADAPAAVAVTAGLGVSGACLCVVHHLRFRRGEPWFPALTAFRFRVAAVRGENRAARPRWTDEELAVLAGKARMRDLVKVLPAPPERRQR